LCGAESLVVPPRITNHLITMNNKTDDDRSEIAKDKVWANIGKLSAVVSLLIALITLFGFLNPDKAKIEARCQFYEIPKRAETSLVNPNDSVNPLYKDLLSEYKNDFVLRCVISNSGKQEASDVVLDLPYEPTFAKLGEKSLTLAKMPGKSINIGILRPKTNVNLSVWFESYTDYSTYFNTCGIGEIMFPTFSYGINGKIAKFLNLIVENPILGFMVILFLVSFFVNQFYEKRKN
jgi:hypothetical protein